MKKEPIMITEITLHKDGDRQGDDERVDMLMLRSGSYCNKEYGIIIVHVR